MYRSLVVNNWSKSPDRCLDGKSPDFYIKIIQNIEPDVSSMYLKTLSSLRFYLLITALQEVYDKQKFSICMLTCHFSFRSSAYLRESIRCRLLLLLAFMDVYLFACPLHSKCLSWQSRSIGSWPKLWMLGLSCWNCASLFWSN